MSNTKRNSTAGRNLALKNLAAKLASIKEDGAQKYSDDFIMAQLRKRFHLENRTIRKILKGYK